jgi:hypothetical protein
MSVSRRAFLTGGLAMGAGSLLWLQARTPQETGRTLTVYKSPT